MGCNPGHSWEHEEQLKRNRKACDIFLEIDDYPLSYFSLGDFMFMFEIRNPKPHLTGDVSPDALKRLQKIQNGCVEKNLESNERSKKLEELYTQLAEYK